MRIGLIVGVFSSNYSLSLFKWISHEVKLCNADLVVIEEFGLNKIKPEDVENSTLFKLINNEHLDGLILLTSAVYYNNSRDVIEELAHKVKIPIVSLGGKIEGISSLVLENYSGFENIVSHLVSHNYRRFALINGPLNHPEAIDRRDAFLKTILSNGLDIQDHLLLEGNFHYISGYSQAEKLVPYIRDGLVDAVVCANDDMAFAAMYCFSQNNIRIPEDIAVTGFDDSPLSYQFATPLTTVNQQFDIMAKKAVSSLFDLIMGHKSIKTYYIKPDLVIRQSCGCKIQQEPNDSFVFPHISSYRVQGKLQMLKADRFFNELTHFLDSNRISQCYIIRYSSPVSFNEPAEAKPNIKGSLFYGYSNGKLVSHSKSYPFENILPNHILESIHEPMLIKPLLFDKIQFGFLFISASEISASFIYDLGIELNHCFEIQYIADERDAIDKRLAEAHESLRISNKRLNELTVKDNLDKFNNLRYLSANLMQYRKKNTGDYILMIVDIDNFNEINSRYGFSEGEYVMTCISNILAKSIRDDDFLSHQSCERYVILVKNIQNDPVLAIGNRFSNSLNEVNSSRTKPYPISFSWGSSLANVESDFDYVYRQAEQSLLDAKGKNPMSYNFNNK